MNSGMARPAWATSLKGLPWSPGLATLLVRSGCLLGGRSPFAAGVLSMALLAVVDVCLAQSGTGIRIDSWTRRDPEMELRLTLPAEWGRRCRVEVSTNLVSWETKLVTEPARGSILPVVVRTPADTAHLFRATLFDWEELRADLQAARERWRTNGLAAYQFHFRWICGMCHPNFREWVRVEVRDGAVIGVTRLADGVPLPRDQWVHESVEGLFDWIQGKLAQHPEVMRVQFDTVQGHPVDGFYDLSALLADEEMRFELNSLR